MTRPGRIRAAASGGAASVAAERSGPGAPISAAAPDRRDRAAPE